MKKRSPTTIRPVDEAARFGLLALMSSAPGRLYTQTVLLTRSYIRLMARAENLFFIMLNALLGKDTSLTLNSMLNLLLESG